MNQGLRMCHPPQTIVNGLTSLVNSGSLSPKDSQTAKNLIDNLNRVLAGK